MVNKKYANGAINITLSILSIIPPCPGNNSLKSFTSKYLFITDAEKSPICPITLNIQTIIPIAIYEISISKYIFMKYVKIKLIINAPIIPAIHPSTDLFGLTLLNLVFPYFFPIKYA